MRYVDILTDPVVAGPHRRVQKLAETMHSRGHLPRLILPEGIPDSFTGEVGSAGVSYSTVTGLRQLRRPSPRSTFHNLAWLQGCASLFLGRLLSDDDKPDFYVINGIVNVHLALHRDLKGIDGMVVVNDTLLPSAIFNALTALLPTTTTLVYQAPTVKRHYAGGGPFSFADEDIMPPGVDLGVFKADPMRKFRAPEAGETLRLGSLCNISTRKRIEDAIDVTYRLARQMPDVNFSYTVTGESLATQGAYLNTLDSMAAGAPSNCRVEFHDPVDQRRSAQFLRSLDWLLVPSSSESFPQSVVQAQAVGTPVIGYDIPGLNDQIVDGETGFLVAPHDVAIMALKISEAVKEPATLTAIAEAARRRVEAEFTTERNVRDFLTIAERRSVPDLTSAALQAKSR